MQEAEELIDHVPTVMWTKQFENDDRYIADIGNVNVQVYHKEKYGINGILWSEGEGKLLFSYKGKRAEETYEKVMLKVELRSTQGSLRDIGCSDELTDKIMRASK